jgi:hypothetical protein
MEFDGTKYRLEVTTPTAGVDDIQRVTSSVLPVSGSFRVGYKGNYTAYLPWNTSVADWKSAIEDLESVRDERWSVTLSDSFDANAVVDITTTHKSGQSVRVKDYWVVDSQGYDGGGVHSDAVVARQQEGSCGWSNGQYEVNVYSYYYRSYDIDKNMIKHIRTI